MSSINYRRLMVSGLLAAVVMIAGQIAVIGTLGPRLMAARDAAHLPPMVPQPLLNVLEVLSLGFAIA